MPGTVGNLYDVISVGVVIACGSAVCITFFANGEAIRG
jgi:hypothetical protein